MKKNITKENAERRKKRRKQTAEIFTPPELVNEMLNKLPDEVWKNEKTFCDPACGNGNFLIYVLWRKLSLGYDSVESLKTIYGVDIKRDNIRECRLRLLKVISLSESMTKDHIRTVFRNIAFLNQKKYPKGSLQYDFSFSNSPDERSVDERYNKINNGELDLVDLPVLEEEFDAPLDMFAQEDESEDRT